jgi:FAD/FMN-containing dehydrogenase
MTVDFDSLARALEGKVIRATDPGYGEARKVWNGAIDRRPGAIVRCAEVSDVVAAVRFARERDVLVSSGAEATASAVMPSATLGW